MKTLPLAALALLLSSNAVSAHVVLSEPEAAPGGYYVGAFRVGHGCAGSPTTALRVEFPVETPNAKPQPKPGWAISIEREKLSQPARGEGGASITERVKAITWRGRLKEEEFEDFFVRIQLPQREGALYLPAIQTCAKGEARWVEIPAQGKPAGEHPAPKLTIAKKPAAAAPDPMAGMVH